MKFKIEDFIGIFEDVVPVEECNNMIDYYKYVESLNLTVNYKNYSTGNRHERSDETVFVLEPEIMAIPATHPTLDLFGKKFWPCYEAYVDYFSSIRTATKHGMLYLRIQKTLPGQGFHQWHFENGSAETSRRLVTFMLFLNDVEEGGETEFLYYHKRVKAKAGTMLIWPSGYPHTHRGNTPLSGEKYIITGWLDLLE